MKLKTTYHNFVTSNNEKEDVCISEAMDKKSPFKKMLICKSPRQFICELSDIGVSGFLYLKQFLDEKSIKHDFTVDRIDYLRPERNKYDFSFYNEQTDINQLLTLFESKQLIDNEDVKKIRGHLSLLTNEDLQTKVVNFKK